MVKKKDNTDTVHVSNVPEELKQQAQIIAIRTGRSLSDVLRELLDQWVQEHQEQKKGK